MMKQYYNALIHTDLIVPVVPEVPYSYENFASTVSVLGIDDKSVLQYLKESPEDYPERLYNKLCFRKDVRIDADLTDGLTWVTKGAVTVNKNIITERLLTVLKETEDQRSRI